MSFEEKYSNIKYLVKNEIDIIENYISSIVVIKEPLQSHILNFLNTKAKRVRLVLPLLYLKALKTDINLNQLKVLSAIEIVHNASLIHDDIIDECSVRRGISTISNEFGNKLGVISGDYLLSLAMNIFSNAGNIEIIRVISQTISKMCIGEINQNFDKFKIGTIENYIEKSKNKTAYLFEAAMLSPLLATNTTDDKIIKTARDFGLNTGIAFQIRDDLINLTGSEDKKPSLNDIKDGIYNAPVIYSGSAEKYLDGVEKTKDLLNNYIEKARINLDILPNNEYKQGLDDFLELLKNG